MGKPALIKLLILACLAAIVSARPSEEVDLTPLEGTEERDPSKITLKHSIAYHFVKHTRSVEADIFVSRKINLSPITDGLITMQDVEERISNLCKQIPEFLREAKEKIEEIEASKPQFYYYPTEGIVSYWPARRHCEARGHQLPEIYDDQTNVEFLEFMRLKKVASTFMGVQYDRNTQIHRFVSTGLPIWAMYHKHLAILQIDGRSTLTQWSEANHQEYARFLYTQKGEVLLHSEDSHKSYAYKGTARSDSYLQQVKASVICQLKWKGGKMLRMPALPEKWSGRDITVPADRHSLPRHCIVVTTTMINVVIAVLITARRPYGRQQQFCFRVSDHNGGGGGGGPAVWRPGGGRAVGVFEDGFASGGRLRGGQRLVSRGGWRRRNQHQRLA